VELDDGRVAAPAALGERIALGAEAQQVAVLSLTASRWRARKRPVSSRATRSAKVQCWARKSMPLARIRAATAPSARQRPQAGLVPVMPVSRRGMMSHESVPCVGLGSADHG
jgi:hypothetical protein